MASLTEIVRNYFYYRFCQAHRRKIVMLDDEYHNHIDMIRSNSLHKDALVFFAMKLRELQLDLAAMRMLEYQKAQFLKTDFSEDVGVCIIVGINTRIGEYQTSIADASAFVNRECRTSGSASPIQTMCLTTYDQSVFDKELRYNQFKVRLARLNWWLSAYQKYWLDRCESDYAFEYTFVYPIWFKISAVVAKILRPFVLVGSQQTQRVIKWILSPQEQNPTHESLSSQKLR